MKKFKLIVILSLLLGLTILISIPSNASEGYVKGAKGVGPGGIDTCYCEEVPFTCWCG